MLRWTVMGFTASLPVTLSLLLALITPARAEEVVITLDQPLRDIQVGVPALVGFTIEGAAPLPAAGQAPLVVATHVATRETVTVAARPETAPGHYVAMLILPSAGRWEWVIHPYGQSAEEPVAMSSFMVNNPAAELSLSAVTAFWLVLTVIALSVFGILGWALYEGRESALVVVEAAVNAQDRVISP